MMRLLLSGFLVVMAAWTPEVLLAQEQQKFQIVVHPDNPVRTVSGNDLSDLFLKKRNRWGDGTQVFPVDLSPDSPVRLAFSEVVHGRTTDKIEKYWQRQIFSGREVPPMVVGSDAEVLAFVRERPGGVGYVSPEAEVGDLRILRVVQPAVAVSKTAPEYTAAARRANLEGIVVLRVHVDETGRIGEIETVEGLRFGLTAQAIAAVRRWQFQPASLDGQPVADTVEVSIRFELR